jgi:CheY-like chemotaxis protein
MSDGKHSFSMKLFVVDDAPAIRASISSLLTEIGYIVRTANDGFAALAEIRIDIPDILLSDLNMPGMSGFELLSVVRRRYPSIQVIAMSGSFSGEEVPSGVIADAFYQKGCSVRSLLRIIEGLGQQKLRPDNPPIASAPLWIQRNGLDSSGRPYATIDCPECLRTFRESVGGSLTPIREAHCIYCHNSIYYAIVDPVEWEPVRASKRPSREANANQSVQTALQG